ncbi:MULTISPECIES: hypothetical protein [unclassified Lysinibacillus]|uniref:hypothetical protein n=1 Tax=unclassified Lysinibacillus TaxID=2636778 RepID=UPI00380B4046
MKTTKWMLVGALTLSLSGTILSSANAVTLDDPTIYGGWSEDTGYFTVRQDSGFSSFATSNPIHRATKEYTRRGSAVYERVIADTTGQVYTIILELVTNLLFQVVQKQIVSVNGLSVQHKQLAVGTLGI